MLSPSLLGQYAKTFHDYGVDGLMLMRLIGEDYDNLEVTSFVHRKKIELELEKILPLSERIDVGSDSLFLKRERMRMARKRDDAASLIQRNFRTYLGKKYVNDVKVLRFLDRNAIALDRLTAANSTWWTDESRALPSFDLPPLSVLGTYRITISY